MLENIVKKILFETSRNLDKIIELAIKERDYHTFIKKTDNLTSFYNILYRGMDEGDEIQNMSFFSDYVGHAEQYGEYIDGIVVDRTDFLYFNDNVFDSLRKNFNSITKKNLESIYQPYFSNYKLDNSMVDNYSSEESVINFVYDFIKSNKPYSTIQKNPQKNDLLIPIMMHYAINNNKNIVVFVGGDYADYGGTEEYVVFNVSKYPKLSNIFKKFNNENSSQKNKK